MTVKLQTLDEAEVTLLAAVKAWRKAMDRSFTKQAQQAPEAWTAEFAYWLGRETGAACATHARDPQTGTNGSPGDDQ